MEYNENQKIAIETAVEFTERKILPIAAEIDEQERFPFELIKELGDAGLLGVCYPEDVGGAGFDYIAYSGVISVIAGTCASTAMTVVAHSTLTANPIFQFGTQSQKDKYLKPLLSGEKLGAFALTEPNAGSDISALETKAELIDDHYILNGSKIFITNANYSDIFVVAAKTAPEKGMMGISLFVMEKGMKGFNISGKKEKKLGMKGSDTGELFFEDAEVPKENLLGRRNFGLQQLHHTLIIARIGMAAIALGISKSALKECLQYVKQRKQFGKTLANFQTIRNMLADMQVSISAGELLIEKAAIYKDSGKNITRVASEAKLFNSEAAMKITKDAIQIFGGYGYSREYPLERFFRDAKLTEIGDGTSEIQRMVIADEVLKKR